MKRTFTWLLGPTVVLALSACGGGAAPASAPQSSAAAAPSSTAAKPTASAGASAAPASAAASAKPAASASAAASPAAGAGTPIKFGVITSLTGGTADAGMNQRDGINLYLEQAKNSMAGRAVEVIFADSQGRADVALPKAKELVENQKVQALLGFVLTPECYAVAPYAREVQVPMIVSNNCGAVHLTTDPKTASPYVFRTTFNNWQQIAPLGDWAYEQGYRKVLLVTADYAGGYEIGDSFAWSFVNRGGSIIQEQYPALGTADFGPFLAQMSQTADAIFVFEPGADGVRWAQQFPDYAGQRKLPVMIGAGAIARDGNLTQLKDKAVGMVANDTWTEALDNPANKSLLQIYQQKFPSQRISSDVANGYVVMQVLQSALEKSNGKIEDKDAFLKTLAATSIDTAKGPVKFDQNRDIVQNMYIYQIVKNGDQYTHKLLKTYNGVTQFYDQTPESVNKFPFGQLKNKWVGMTKDQLGKLASG